MTTWTRKMLEDLSGLSAAKEQAGAMQDRAAHMQAVIEANKAALCRCEAKEAEDESVTTDLTD